VNVSRSHENELNAEGSGQTRNGQRSTGGQYNEYLEALFYSFTYATLC